MNASYLFNILGIIAYNLRAVIEFTHIKKTKVLSYHSKLTKDSKYLVGTSSDGSSALI